MAFILSGKGTVEVNNERFEAKAGDSVWVPKGTSHWFINSFDEPWEVIFAYSRPSLKEAGLKVME